LFDHSSSQPSEASSRADGPPYEKALTVAFEKLTDQVLVFLLAYVILLIGLSVFASGVADKLRVLFYIIPILGVAAYVWMRRHGLSRKMRGRDVRVRSGIASGPGTYVAGERGAVNQGAGRTTAESLIATGGATVVGRDVATKINPPPMQPFGAQYLLEIFQTLDERNQKTLVGMAKTLHDQQSNPLK
jgi:hypothetical protein